MRSFTGLLLLVGFMLAFLPGCNTKQTVAAPPAVTAPAAAPEVITITAPCCEDGKACDCQACQDKDKLIAELTEQHQAAQRQADIANDRAGRAEQGLELALHDTKELRAQQASIKVNGTYYRNYEGRTQRWEAVVCYGPGQPCEWGWVDYEDSVLVPSSAPSSSSGPACGSGGCGQRVQRSSGQQQQQVQGGGGGWYLGKNLGRRK